MNAIHALLDRLSLPWRKSQTALAERFGAGEDPWWDGGRRIVQIHIAPPPLPNLLRPLAFVLEHDPQLPPVRFSGYAWTGRSTGALWWRREPSMNALDEVTAVLTAALGPPEPVNPLISYSTTSTWRSGAAAIHATAWENRHRGNARNIVHEREPRTAEACSIEIETGYRPPCSAAEQEWIAAFTPSLTLDRAPSANQIIAGTASQYLLDFIREPCPGFEATRGKLGRSPGGEALIFTTGQLYIVPVVAIENVSVERVQPARGGGGAWVHLEIRADRDGARPRTICLRGGYGYSADGLNDAGEEIARWIGVPCVLQPYSLDD